MARNAHMSVYLMPYLSFDQAADEQTDEYLMQPHAARGALPANARGDHKILLSEMMGPPDVDEVGAIAAVPIHEHQDGICVGLERALPTGPAIAAAGLDHARARGFRF
jgi:hypothetical protein